MSITQKKIGMVCYYKNVHISIIGTEKDPINKEKVFCLCIAVLLLW
jgi:hypothetical protein